MASHKQINLKGVEVDEGLVDLLENVWEAGINTQFSCQGGTNPAMIVFPTVTDGLRFVEETLAVTGTYGCYTGRLMMQIVNPWPADGPSRFLVEWPAEFTPVWEAAWNGEAMPLRDVLDICERMKPTHCPVSALKAAEGADHA